MLFHSVYHNKTPDSIQNTFAVDFFHAHDTRANNLGSLNLPMVDSVSFGKNSIRSCSINSWNLVQSLLLDYLVSTESELPPKMISFDKFALKSLLKGFFIACY